MTMDDESRQIAQRVDAQRQAQAAEAGYAGSIMRDPNFRVVTGEVPGLGDMSDLSAAPGTPGYYAKLASSTRPAPDPVPPQASILLLPNTTGTAVGPPLVGVTAAESSSKRVAIYVGRGEDFVVAVEEAPEWEAVDQWKLAPGILLALVPILRALGVRYVDRSGGEFKALEKTGELG